MNVKPIPRLHLFRIAQQVAKARGEQLATTSQIANHFDVATQHLTYVVSGMRRSHHIEQWVDQFIDTHLGDLLDYLLHAESKAA